MVAPAKPNLEGLISLENLDTTDGSQLVKYVRDTMDPSLSWKDVEWLKSITSLPILLKGILTAEDARKAVEAGAAGVIVSNHGGRQLDYAPATISVLEEIVKAVAGAVPVLVDGGIRRGTDVLKALALGARAVMVGRPVMYGLAARGEAGAKHVIEMLNRDHPGPCPDRARPDQVASVSHSGVPVCGKAELLPPRRPFVFALEK